VRGGVDPRLNFEAALRLTRHVTRVPGSCELDVIHGFALDVLQAVIPPAIVLQVRRLRVGERVVDDQILDPPWRLLEV